MNKLTKIFVGVDVSKDHLDIHLFPLSKSFRVQNTDAGLKKLTKELSLHENIECIAFESTGGYESKMARTLQKAEYQTWLIDPVCIKSFIRSEGIMAKTDMIDAKMIALFSSQKKRKYVPKPLSDDHIELRALVKRKEALTKMIAEEKRRLVHPLQTVTCRLSITDMIQILEQQKSKIDRMITKAIASNNEWGRRAEIMRSIPGVGEVTAAVLVSYMPELGSVDHKKIAALMGVAPYSKESGYHKGKASIYAGRFAPRLPLYMATLTGVRCNPVLKEFYTRLRNAGKPAKVALVAAMRKLLSIINAMLRDQIPWKTASC